MAKIKCYMVSCSSDAEMDARKLYVWGGYERIRWCAETRRETQKQVLACQREYECVNCDAEIHMIELERTVETNKQKLANPKKD